MRLRRRGISLLALIAALALVLAWTGRPGGPGDRPLRALDPPARIVAFGTSLTHDEPWTADLAARLSACFGTEVQVIAIAGPGQGSAWGLDQVSRVIAEAPDLVLVEFAINDARIRNGASLARSRAQHDAILDAVSEVPAVLMTMSPVRGPEQWLKRWRLPAYYRLYGDLAEDRGLGLIDLYSRWRAEPERFDAPDGLHPGGAAAAGLIGPVVTRAIAAAAGRSGCS